MKTKVFNKSISILLVLVLLISLFTIPAYAVGLETTVATLGGLTAKGVATLSTALSGLGITVGGVALAVAGGVAVALLVRHVYQQLNAQQVADLNAGTFEIDTAFLQAVNNVISTETTATLDNPFEWNKTKYNSIQSGQWSSQFITDYVSVIPFLMLSNIEYTVYSEQGSSGVLLGNWDSAFNQDLIHQAGKNYGNYYIEFDIANTFSGANNHVKKLLTTTHYQNAVPDVSPYILGDTNVYGYRYGTASSSPYYTEFIIGLNYSGRGIEYLQPYGSTSSWLDTNLEYMIPNIAGLSATMPISYIDGVALPNSVSQPLSETYERDNTVGVVGTVITAPTDFENDFVLNPDGSVSISNDLVLNPSIPQEQTWLDTIVGTITGAIDSVIDAITSPFGELTEFVDGVADYFSNIDGIGDLFNHYLPACVAGYAFIGFMILLAFWILRMILNR